MDIAVIGGGNGGFAAAADLSEQGHKVRFWRRNPAGLEPLRQAGGVRLLDHRGERLVPIDLIDNDLGRVMGGAQLIVIPLPATVHEGLALVMAPHFTDGQVVFLPPGTLGTVLFARAMQAIGNRSRVAFAETGTLPWLARKRGDASVAISVRATRLPTGIYPARRAKRSFPVVQEAFPAVEPILDDVLDAALMNAGPIIHPPLITMNAGPLEHSGDWDIHNEGTQPAIRRVTDALDAERIRLREALGYAPPHFPLRDHYDTEGEEWMYGRKSHEKLTDSNDWREPIDLTAHRYMLEDVKLGLALLVSLGHWKGIDMPVASGLLALGGAVVGEDFLETGRTLKSLGLAHFDHGDLARQLWEGVDP